MQSDPQSISEPVTRPAEEEPASQSQPDSPQEAPLPGPSLPPPTAATMGPSLPPADDTGENGLSYPEEPTQEAVSLDDQAAPSSPYTADRSLIHTLTLPTVPNMDIPPSPPGSPSSSSAQTTLTAKFDKFLELKRTKGQHFNARIADSHALKNPPLMDKLLGFAGVGTDGEAAVEQYATTLPVEVWDPAGFPEWAYRGPLRKTQERMQKENARGRGEAVQFVPAS